MSQLTVFLGEFFGITISLMCIVLVARPKAVLIALASLTANAGLLYISGAFTLAGGVATVLGHDVWSGGAVSVIITALGWVMLIKGMALMAVPPALLDRFYKIIQTPNRLRIAGVIYVVFGLWLSWAACQGGQLAT